MDDSTQTKQTKARSFLTELLAGWGLPATWAKLLAAALMGALIALASSGCSCGVDYQSLYEIHPSDHQK